MSLKRPKAGQDTACVPAHSETNRGTGIKPPQAARLPATERGCPGTFGRLPSSGRQAVKNGPAFFFKQWGTWGADGVKRSKYANGKLLKGKVRQALPV
jgi:hypothetical protein